MIPVISGDVPVYLHANGIQAIQAGIDWAMSEDLGVVLVGGYDAWRAQPEDSPRVLAFVSQRFSIGWAFQVEQAMAHDPPDVHVAWRRDELVAFAAHDGNNRGLGWFGPAGTDEDHRGVGLGQALLLGCLLDIAAGGHKTADIAWIGPRRFYERSCGAVQGRRFVVLERELGQNERRGASTT